MKLWKFPSLSMVNPTAVPEFEIPFSVGPGARVGARVRAVEIGELEAARVGRAEDRRRSGRCSAGLVVGPGMGDLRVAVGVARRMRHRGGQQGTPFEESRDGFESRRRSGRGFRNMEHLPGSGWVRTTNGLGCDPARPVRPGASRDRGVVCLKTGFPGVAQVGECHAPVSPLPGHCRMRPGSDRVAREFGGARRFGASPSVSVMLHRRMRGWGTGARRAPYGVHVPGFSDALCVKSSIVRRPSRRRR